MANCRFIRFNQNKARRVLPLPYQAPAVFPRIINGNTGVYAGCSPRAEDPAFPMDNALYAGRKGNVWVVPDGTSGNHTDGTSMILEVDLGSLQTIMACGVLGWSNGGGLGSFPQSVFIDAQPGVSTTAAYSYGAYTPAFGSAINTGLRDGGTVFTFSVSSRFWRFRWPSASSGHGFSIASVVVALVPTDIGFLYSGADEQRVRPRAVVESFDQTPTITYVGPEFVRWSIQFNNNDAALRTILDNLYGDTQPFIFLTPDNEWQECIWGTEEFSREHIFAPPDRYRFLVELRQLS